MAPQPDKQIYRVLNWVLLGLALYALSWPLLSPALQRLFPALIRCPFQAITGRECIFCGMTTGFRSILGLQAESGGAHPNPLSLAVFFGVLGELAFRVIALILLRRPQTQRPLIYADLGMHLPLAVALTLLATGMIG